MAIETRPADLVADRSLIIQTLQRFLEPRSDDRRFDWLYRYNPSGQAKAWIACETESGDIVGMAAAFPRCVRIGAHSKVAWVFGDFCVAERYRSLGPALQLQRACLDACNRQAVTFCYDFPSVSMLAVYKRLGITDIQQMLRFAKALRVDRKVRAKIKGPLAARGLTVAGNLLLGWRDRLRKADATVVISIHEGPCDEEFSLLAQRLNGQIGVWVQRSADYLNWRYLDHPLRRYELLTARRRGELLAYLVFSHDQEDAFVADLFGEDDPAVLGALLAKVTVLMRERGVMTLSVPIMDSHPWVPLLQRLGFRVRDTGPAVIHALPHDEAQHIRVPDLKWCFMSGDRDS